MMQVIHCRNCNGTSIGLNATHVNVNFEKNVRCCEHCNNTSKESKYFMFCCENCFNEYILKVANGTASFNDSEISPPVQIQVSRD
jgi:hypothetical protein